MRLLRRVVVDMDLSRESIREGVKEIRAFRNWLTEKERELTKRLADIGWGRATVRFASIAPFYNNGKGYNYSISVRRIGRGFAIRASGKDICFIEFGAGIRYGYGYKGERPDSIVGIGEYGNKQGGNENGWWYTSASGESEHTYGNPPASGMYEAEQAICQQVYKIANEVFR